MTSEVTNNDLFDLNLRSYGQLFVLVLYLIICINVGVPQNKIAMDPIYAGFR